MIAHFFKQSKPIVFIVLFGGLSLSFFVKLSQILSETTDYKRIMIYGLKYASLIATFLIFISVLKHFEVQKRHGLGHLYFTLLSCLCMPFLIEGHTLFGLFFVSLAIYNSYRLSASQQPHLSVFQMALFFFIASLFEPTFVYMLFMVLVASILFISPSWRLLVIPVFAISTVVLWIQVYGLMFYDSVFGFGYFFQKWTFNFNMLNAESLVWFSIFWAICFVLFVFQFIKIREKRALFHINNAKFFIFFLIIAFASQALTIPRIEKLWVLSIWPFAIYIADFVWRLRKKVWAEVFVLVSIICILILRIFF